LIQDVHSESRQRGSFRVRRRHLQGRIVESREADAVFSSDEPAARQLITGATTGQVHLRDV
jgi:lactam utilization protein B